MKKIFIILGFIFMLFQLKAQNNYYYADGIPQYWRDDSTSVNIIVKNMHNYNASSSDFILQICTKNFIFFCQIYAKK